MKAIKFKEQNITFTKPEGLTDEQCGSLPAYRGDGEIVSCWELNAEEIKALQDNGGRIWLGICSSVQPPVYLTVTSPFVNPPQVETEA
jgi:hypothetical protein